MWQYPKFRPPDGESLNDVAKRARKALNYLVTNYEGKTIAVISHGSFIRNFLAVLLDLPLEEVNNYGFANASMSVARYSPQSGGEVHILNKPTEN